MRQPARVRRRGQHGLRPQHPRVDPPVEPQEHHVAPRIARRVVELAGLHGEARAARVVAEPHERGGREPPAAKRRAQRAPAEALPAVLRRLDRALRLERPAATAAEEVDARHRVPIQVHRPRGIHHVDRAPGDRLLHAGDRLGRPEARGDRQPRADGYDPCGHGSGHRVVLLMLEAAYQTRDPRSRLARGSPAGGDHAPEPRRTWVTVDSRRRAREAEPRRALNDGPAREDMAVAHPVHAVPRRAGVAGLDRGSGRHARAPVPRARPRGRQPLDRFVRVVATLSLLVATRPPSAGRPRGRQPLDRFVLVVAARSPSGRPALVDRGFHSGPSLEHLHENGYCIRAPRAIPGFRPSLASSRYLE